MCSPVVLEAIDVSRRFGATAALSEVSLQVRAGELFGLVGPDGAGKTTLVRTLAGLIGVHAGRVAVLGRDPLTDASLRDEMGVMPQHYSLYGDLSVDENLRFFADLYCLPKKAYTERRARLLELTRLHHFVERRVDALSGGMYKKLALACALLHEPSVLLLDEPTNGVDPVSRRELWQLLHEFVHGGMAILISTAYMDEASRCHGVCLLYQGRVIAKGSPDQLVKDLRVPVFDVEGGDRQRLHEYLAGTEGVISASPAGAHLRIVISENSVGSLRQGLGRLGASLVTVPPDFEDVFLASIHASRTTEHSASR